jgi:hypothetical protein
MEVFMVDGGRKSVVVGRIVRVMMLHFGKYLFEIMSINGLAIAAPTLDWVVCHSHSQKRNCRVYRLEL